MDTKQQIQQLAQRLPGHVVYLSGQGWYWYNGKDKTFLGISGKTSLDTLLKHVDVNQVKL
jgi:hypothetical protein